MYVVTVLDEINPSKLSISFFFFFFLILPKPSWFYAIDDYKSSWHGNLGEVAYNIV